MTVQRTVTALLVAVLPIRIALDLLWWVEIAGFSVPRHGSLLLACGLLAAVVARWRRAIEVAWRWPAALLVLFVAVGALRAESGLDAVRYGLHLLLPVLWAAALHSWPIGPRVPAAWIAAALAASALSLGYLAAGQPAAHVLHGWPRLIGAYGNLHGHAAVMAAFAATALVLAAAGRSRAGAVLGLASAICVAATWVRGAWLWVGIALAVALVVRVRAPLAAVALAAVAAVALGVGVLRERLADLVAVFTLTPPPGGWDALGSWRVRIWADVLSGWLDGPPADWLLGRGLGGHLGLHRHLEPHSDVLSILVQIGPVGLLAWAGWLGTLGWASARRARRDPVALAALSALAGALCVAVISNDFAFRPTPALWVVGWCALATSPGARSPSSGSDAPPGPSPA